MVESQDDKLQSLLNAALLLNSTMSMGDILHTFGLFATQHTGADRTTLYIMDRYGKHLLSEVVQGDEVSELRIPVGTGIAGHVAESGESLNIDDMYSDPRFDPSSDRESGYRSRNCLALPIKDRKGAVIGVLQVLNKQGGGGFTAEDERYLKILAGHAGVAIQNAQTFESMAKEQNDLQAENTRLRSKGKGAAIQPIGSSPRFREAVEMARSVAGSTANVLLRGESGTGKGVFAKFLHQEGPRAKGPFTSLNCSAIPSDLVEAELFGIERGVATGVEARKGRLEMANHGTCFLDEIGDMSQAAQAKVLKVLEDRECERVGGRQTIQLDVRVVAATHRDLEEAIQAKEFRADLYYRLNVVAIWIPPLRTRGSDVLELAQFFMERFAKANARGRMSLAQDTLAMLSAYSWPGNVRELENVMERAVILSRESTIQPEVLPPEIRSDRAAASAQLIPVPSLGGVGQFDAPAPSVQNLRDSMEAYEAAIIRNALRAAGGVQTGAARDLGISESNLRYKMKKLGIDA